MFFQLQNALAAHLFIFKHWCGICKTTYELLTIIIWLGMPYHPVRYNTEHNDNKSNTQYYN